MKTKSIIFIDIFAPKWTRAQRKLTRFPSREPPRVLSVLIGSLSNNDGDGYKNVT